MIKTERILRKMCRKNYAYYIVNNDFIGAKERLEQATKNWKSHWYECCIKIAENNKEYYEKYLFDENTFTITKVKVVVKYTKQATSHTYLIDLLDSREERVFTKVGKANDVADRLNKILSKGYAEADVEDLKILKVYEMPTPDLAEALESLIRNYIKTNKNVGFYPLDRFTPFTPTEEDYKAFEVMKETLLTLYTKSL